MWSRTHKKTFLFWTLSTETDVIDYTGTAKKLNMVKKYIFSCNLFQKVKLSYILDSLHVK